MNITNKNIDEIKPYEKNPRKNDAAVEYVANSIREFGFKVPIVIDKDGVIVAGHTRYKASKKLGLKEVPCIVADDLTEEQIKAYRLADNKVAEKSEWDLDLLGDELGDILNIDMSQFDFDLGEEEEEKEVIEDDYDAEPPEEPKAKYGDIYQLGRHRLMCGDSTKIEDVEKLMGDGKADIIFTDPPYGNGKSGKYGRGQLGIRTIKGDKDLTVFSKVIQNLEFSKIVYFLQWRTICESFEKIMQKGLKINTVAVWDKKNAGLNGAGGISEQWEAIVFAGDINYKKFGGNVFSISREHNKRKNSPHPHQKPIKLISDIFAFIDGCNNVFDPFGGSGSSLIACEQLDKKCYMMELDPKYVDVIIDRWEQFTGQKAVLLNK